MLGLVLLTIVFSNVILSNYQMNELDRKTMQEKLSLLNATRTTRSEWFTAQNEYSVFTGGIESGTYLQTQVADGKFEAFMGQPVLTNTSFNPSAHLSEMKRTVVSAWSVEYKIAEAWLDRLTIDNVFALDLSALPLDNVQGIEIALRYNVSRSEKWFLKAYNWTASDFSDYGFNNTVGNLPLLSQWNDYAVNVVNGSKDYVSSNGTVRMELQNEASTTSQTALQIDFFGVRAIINGICIDLHNSGPLATHVVAAWILNSTYHDRRDVDIFVNPAEDASVTIADLAFPQDNFTVKAVTEIGNEAVFP
jgi:hypothetical protein